MSAVVATEPAPRRRALFVALTLALPWLLLALAELSLRAGDYGSDYPLFTLYAPHPDYLLSSPDAARRYFHGAFVPTPHTDFFRASKPPGTFRIFFQGESSAQGFPYLHGASPSRMIEAWLQHDFPGRDIEVVNTAFTAISSYVLLDQADAILAQHPDAVLIYTGHNEYYGVFGAGASGPLGRSPALVRAYLALRRLRLVQLVEHALGAARGGDDGPNRSADDRSGSSASDAPRSVMVLMAGDQHVALGAARFAAGVAQFRANLGALLARYQAAHVPVFVGTLVSNERDQPPFVSGFTPGADSAAWRRAVDGAVASGRRGDTAAAVAGLRAAVRVDPAPADAHYALARLLEARGDTVGARPEYRAAKERDELRFRAPEALNAVIREEAAEYGATVVESQAAVERASPGGVPGHSLILEHLHPNVAGYAVIARAFYDALRARELPAALPASAPAPALADVPVTAVDSAAGALRTDRLLSGWPFRPRGAAVVPAVDTLRPRTRVEALARALVLGEIPWPEATDALRAEYARAGDTTRALTVSRVMAQEFRYSPQPWLDAARLAAAARRYAEALDDARRAAARRETPEGLRLVGLLALRAGERDAALAALARAAQLAPDDRKAALTVTAARALPLLASGPAAGPAGSAGDATRLYNLAVAYALLEQYDSARAALAALRRAAPGDPRAADLAQRVPPA
ncbi:hypothetical protein tb265_23780 [Gemmatimonadetes bacterium T265]|nr:hypothetical protein tb265_23780 [Gemmatimonadetes bacterium T265]